jgi:anti-sigma factor RsiW
MDCTRDRSSIHDLVDGTLGPIRRAEIEQHLEACDVCRALAADLQYIRDTAESLDQPVPPARVWLQITGQLRQEGRIAPPVAAPIARRHAALFAVAAALLLAVSASIVFLLRADRNPGAGDAPAAQAGNAAIEDPVQAIADEIRLAETHYQNAIVKLEAVAKLDEASGQSTLDPQTAATLQKSLLVIDQAIAESRAAVRTEPQNEPARDSLFEALRRKVALLQDTVVLMNEMRRGDSAGAAQAMEGLNKS